MRNILIALGAVAVLAIAGVAIYQWQAGPSVAPLPPPVASTSNASAEEAARARAIGPGDYAIGKADAPVQIIEYASLTCPHCADFHVNVLPVLKKEYVDTGKARIAFRDFPLDQAALAAAMLARCAGPDRRGAMHDLFFSRLRQWAASPEPIAALAQLAALAGMGTGDVQACLGNQSVEKAVLDERLLAERVFDINATPSFIINGTKHSGGMTVEQFKAVIDPLLAGAPAAQPAAQ